MTIKNTIWGYENKRTRSLLTTFHRTRELARNNKRRLGVLSKNYAIVAFRDEFGFEVA